MVDSSALEALGGTGTYETIGNAFGISANAVIVFIAIVSIWTLVWKGFALWKAANKKSIPWFVILLVFNTVGILEILYIFIFSKISFKGKKLTFERSKKKKK